MTTQTDNKQVTRQLLAIFEHGRLEEIDRLVHPQFVNYEAPPGSPQGAEGLKQTVQADPHLASEGRQSDRALVGTR